MKKFYVIYMNQAQTDYDVKVSSTTFDTKEEFEEQYASSCKILEMVPVTTVPQVMGLKIYNHLQKNIAESQVKK